MKRTVALLISYAEPGFAGGGALLRWTTTSHKALRIVSNFWLGRSAPITPRLLSYLGGEAPSQPHHHHHLRGTHTHLRLGEHERRSHLEALRPGQVLVELELVLQLQQLLAGEGGAGPPAFAQQVGLSLSCGRGSETTKGA